MGLMGLLKKGFLISVLAILVLVFAPGIPPHLKIEPFTLTPARRLEGKLSANSILDKAEEVKLDREIIGPESVALRGDELFTGIVGGELVRIKDGKVKTITRIGTSCDGVWDYLNCGRIAGTRFDSDGKLLVADVAKGIYKVDVDTGSIESLVSMSDQIEGVRPMFPDDLDVDKDGVIYWSDASTIADAPNLILEALGGPTGRLVKYDQKTKKSSVLMTGLHFPNGIQLAKNEEFVLVTETLRARVWRYFLKGEKKGQKDIFIDGLPGLPDNIRSNGKDGFYIVLAQARIDSEPSSVDLLAPLALVRRFILRLRFIAVSILSAIEENFFPGPVLREWIFYAQSLGPLGDLGNCPYRSIIVETDKDGNIIGSLHNKNGPVTCISEIAVGKDYAYLGTPFQRRFFRIKKEDLMQS